MAVKERAVNAVATLYERYRKLMESSTGWKADIPNFVIGFVTALIPSTWVQILLLTTYLVYQALEIWYRASTCRGNGGCEEFTKVLADFRQFIVGLVLGFALRSNVNIPTP